MLFRSGQIRLMQSIVLHLEERQLNAISNIHVAAFFFSTASLK
jgi:hypothetical protein